MTPFEFMAVVTLERERAATKAHIMDALKDRIQNFSTDEIYFCAPPPMRDEIGAWVMDTFNFNVRNDADDATVAYIELI